MHRHKGQMRSGTSQVCINLHVGRGTWSLRLASLPGRASSSSLPSCCADVVSVCHVLRKAARRWAPLHAPPEISLNFLPALHKGKCLDLVARRGLAGGKESFVFLLIGSKGRAERVNGVSSAQM